MGVGLSVILNRGGSLQCADGLLESSVLCALGASHAQNLRWKRTTPDHHTCKHSQASLWTQQASFSPQAWIRFYSWLHLRSEMDVIPMCSIFQELQIVHDTGYFSALPSLEEYWQQVTTHSLHRNAQLDTSPRVRVPVRSLRVISLNLLSTDSCVRTCDCQSYLRNSRFDFVQQPVSLLKVDLHAFTGEVMQVPSMTALFNIPVIVCMAQRSDLLILFFDFVE